MTDVTPKMIPRSGNAEIDILFQTITGLLAGRDGEICLAVLAQLVGAYVDSMSELGNAMQFIRKGAVALMEARGIDTKSGS